MGDAHSFWGGYGTEDANCVRVQCVWRSVASGSVRRDVVGVDVSGRLCGLPAVVSFEIGKIDVIRSGAWSGGEDMERACRRFWACFADLGEPRHELGE